MQLKVSVSRQTEQTAAGSDRVSRGSVLVLVLVLVLVGGDKPDSAGFLLKNLKFIEQILK